MNALRRRTWQILEVARPGDRTSRVFDLFIRGLIGANVVAVVVETVPEVEAAAGAWLHGFEVFSVAVFSVEYLLRVWSCVEHPDRYDGPAGRLRFAVTPLALVDLLAVAPAYLTGLGVDLRILRGVRLFRLFRILKLARYSRALRTMGRVFRRKRAELAVTFSMVVLVVLVASTLMYYAEHAVQPEAFGSIPEALWWGVVTLTTLGYGDVYPVTVVGRIMGGVFAVCGLLLVALPTAILGSAYVEELSGPPERPSRDPDAQGRCPHCGRPLDGGDPG